MNLTSENGRGGFKNEVGGVNFKENKGKKSLKESVSIDFALHFTSHEVFRFVGFFVTVSAPQETDRISKFKKKNKKLYV